MEDKEIIELYVARSQDAIKETSSKYNNYCTTIAYNILRNSEDTEECVSDVYLNAWNAIPPTIPNILSAFLGRLARNAAIQKYRYKRSARRGSGEVTILLDELAECVSGISSVEEHFERTELVNAIKSFLDTLSEESRIVFLKRYWYAKSIVDVSKECSISEGKVKTLLFRMRGKLKEHLSNEGISVY